MRLVLAVLLAACGSSKSASYPKDMGGCKPFDQGGKSYYLCERAGGGLDAVPTEPPWQTESERLKEAEDARERSERDAHDAEKMASEAVDRYEKLQHDLDELENKVNAAVDSVVAAQNEADRASAKAKLEQLRKERAEQDARLAAAKAAAQKAARMRGQKISKECQDNPLAKGCI